MAPHILAVQRIVVNSVSQPIRFAGFRCCLLAALLIGCKTDCVYYPCPAFEAITLTVSAAGSSTVPPAIAIAFDSGPAQTGLCDTLGVCHLVGGPALYHLTITASGFTPRSIDVTVTGEAAGCNTCGHVDRQQLSVALQPTL